LNKVRLLMTEEALGVVFERDLELIEEGFFEPGFGQAGVFDQQGNGDLAVRMVIEVDLYGICTVDILLGRDHFVRSSV